MSDRSSRADVNGVKRSSRQPGPASSAISSRIPTGIRRWGAVGSIILASTAGATAQQSSTPVRSVEEFDPQEVVRIDLQAVEESIGDQGALDQSLRWVPSGLQLPAGYAQVYARSGGGFFRADGGLVATFDRSIYVPTQYGPMPDIPASTLFVIGGVPMGAEPGHGRLVAVDPLDPGRLPEILPPTAIPDELHDPSAVPGDRFARFGFGPGHRIPVRADAARTEAEEAGTSSRFRDDGNYRAVRLARLVVAWRAAESEEDRAGVRSTDPAAKRSGDSGPEDVPSTPPGEAARPDRSP